MAPKAKKPAPKKSAPVQSRTGAGAAIGERSKDAAKKPTFGKAAPRKVTPAARATAFTDKPAAKTAKASSGPSLATKIAQVAAGAVVATAKRAASLATSVVGKDKTKAE